jgi:hypothetical protein
MTISKKQSNPGLSDPVLARQTEASLAQAAVIARGKPTVTSAGELILPSTTVSTTSNSFTTTTSANNQTADTVTINRTSGTVYVNSIDQTIQQTVINNPVAGVSSIIAGNNITITSTGTSGTGDVTISAIGDGNANTGNWEFIDNTMYNMAGGEINNGDTTHGATAGLILPNNGNAGAGASLFNTYGNIGIAVANLANSSNTSVWAFGVDGNLTLPANTFAVKYANGTAVAIPTVGNIATINLNGSNSNVLYGNGVFAAVAGGANTGNVTFDDINVIGTGNLKLQPDSANANAYLDIFLTAGPDIHIAGNGETVILGTDDFANVAVNVNGNVSIQAGDANGTHTWNFDTTGNLILAGGNSVIQSIANSSSEPLYPNVSTMVFTPDALLSSQALVLDPTGPSHIHLRAPGANIDEPDANIFLGGEASSFEVGYYNGNVPNLYIHSNNNTWTFDNAGNLTLPLGSIVYETNIPDGALSGSAIALKPIGGTTANQQLLIYPTAADGDHIHMTSGNLYATELFLGSDNLYVKLANTGNVVINSNDGNSSNAMWTFDTAGNVTIPGSIIGTNTINIDNRDSGNTADIQLYSADDILIQARDRTLGSGSPGGDIRINAGDSAEDGDTGAGAVYISAGAGGESNLNNGGGGGAISIGAGDGGDAIGASFTAGNGGDLVLTAGDAGDNNDDIDLGATGGDVNIIAGMSSGNGIPGGSVYINSGRGDPDSEGGPDGNVEIQIGNNGSTWIFDSTGNLTLPGNTFDVNYANGTQVSIGGGANTGNVTFSDQVVIGTGSNDGSGGLYLAPGNNSIANSAVQYLRVRGGDVVTHIHLDTGNNAFYDQYFGDDGKYIKLANTGNVVIGSDDANGNSAQWTFDTTGNLTTPSNLVIGPGPGSGSSIFQYNQGLQILGEGANSVVQMGWTANTSAPDSVTTIAMNYPGGGEGNVLIAVGNNATTVNYWLFDNTGNLRLPGNTFAVNYANGTQVSLGGGNVTWAEIDDKSGNSGPTIITLGQNAGFDGQGNAAIAIGKNAGQGGQGASSITIGEDAGGNTTQGANSVAIGRSAGFDAQGIGAVAIGSGAGSNTQGNQSVAIGENAGVIQGSTAVAIGQNAGGGVALQGDDAVAIGHDAGSNAQGTQAVAIGLYAGQTTQGTNSIAIGANAGITSQGNNSIILNATGANLNQTVANTFTVSPVRNDTSNIAEVMFYNATSKEVTYGNTISVAGNITGAYVLGNGSQLTGISTSFDLEMHVSKDGNDSTGTGTILRPYLTITHALTQVAGGRNTIVIHPGAYTENPTITNLATQLITYDATGASTLVYGTVTIANTTGRIAGLKMTNLAITGNAQAYINSSTVDEQFTKSSSGYVEVDDCELQTTGNVLISGSGITTIIGNKINNLVVNNAGANVLVKGANDCLMPQVTAGSLNIVDSIIRASSNTANAVTASAGTVVTLMNNQIVTPAADNVARVSIAGYHSIISLVYDKANSTLSNSLNSVAYFQTANVDSLVSSGNITGNYILGNGSGLTSLPAPTVAQDITSNGAMSIMTYDGNLKYVNYATVEPSTGNIAGGNISTTGVVTANTANITTGNITTINSGLLQNGNSNITITSNGNISIQAAGSNVELVVTSTGANITGTLTSTGKIGYASGSTVTQTSNRGNGVNINALAGTIVTVSASMTAGEIGAFSVTNNQVDTNNDIVLVQVVSPNLGNYNVIANPNSGIGGFYLTLQNISGFPISAEAVTIRFMVIKAPNA